MLFFVGVATAAALTMTGCSLAVNPFDGSVLQLAWEGSTTTSPSQHLELWARNQYNDVIRITGRYTPTDPAGNKHTVDANGIVIRLAVDPNDPCIINSKGALLTTPGAYPGNVTINGVTQTPAEQAQQVINRIAQVTSGALGGTATTSLLAVVPYDGTPAPSPGATPTDAERLATCQAYWGASLLSYTGNPAQVTAPTHGAVLGFIAFSTQIPVAGIDGFKMISPDQLSGIQELWATVESVPPEMVDPLHRGPIYIDGTPTPGGIDVVHFDLVGNDVSGTAAIYNNLDDGTVSL